MDKVNIDLVAGRKKKKRKIRNEEGKGSGKSEEAEEYNTQRRIITQSDGETVNCVTMLHTHTRLSVCRPEQALSGFSK